MTHGVVGTRDLVLELWTKTRIDWGFATDRLAASFRRQKSLPSAERRLVAETLYGMIRQVRRIDFALEGVSLRGAERELARYLAYRVLAGEMTPAEAGAELRADWEAVARVDERIAGERDPVRRLGLSRSIPDWLARRFQAELGDEADALAASLNARAPLSIRANRLKTTPEALAERLAAEGIETHPGRFGKSALVLDTRVNVFGLAAFKEGLFEVQDEASQLVAEVTAPPPRGLVIDACAGAGGKTLALGALLENRGRLLALDVDPKKLEGLSRRARRAGLSNHRALEIDAAVYPDEVEALRGRADRVLVDAPCSGIGALRRNPEARWRLSEDDIPRLAREQLGIARRAMALVAPGGRLVYATCTVLRQENEAVVEQLLAPGWEVMRVAEIWGRERAAPVTDPSGTYLKLRPNRHDTDGFFAAILYRRAG
jgi:16S rRNA (cytosine967-C5)-methyltransferase